jgi:hypothetical protein
MYASRAPTVFPLVVSGVYSFVQARKSPTPSVKDGKRSCVFEDIPVASLLEAFFLWSSPLQVVEILNSPELTHLPQDPVAPMKHIPRWASHIEPLGIG